MEENEAQLENFLKNSTFHKNIENHVYPLLIDPVHELRKLEKKRIPRELQKTLPVFSILIITKILCTGSTFSTKNFSDCTFGSIIVLSFSFDLLLTHFNSVNDFVIYFYT